AVERNGYVTAEYGQRTISDPGAILTLTPGTNRTGLIFRMVSAAVISGRIFDDDGEPVPNAIVTAARDAYREGKRTLAIEASAQTNDLGEYRLYGMKPGSYYVAAVETSQRQVSGDRQYAAGNSQAPEQGHVKTYYPGTIETAKSAAITVKAGEEIPSTDIVLRQVIVYRIRGHVSALGMQKLPSGIGVSLAPKTGRMEWDQGSWRQIEKEDGSFEFSDVQPGIYELNAYWFDQNKRYSAMQTLQV